MFMCDDACVCVYVWVLQRGFHGKKPVKNAREREGEKDQDGEEGEEEEVEKTWDPGGFCFLSFQL